VTEGKRQEKKRYEKSEKQNAPFSKSI